MHLHPRAFLLFGMLCSAVPLPQSKAFAQTVGERLPPRPEGGIDIHHINTGEGSAAYFILPDGTTLLVDCGHGYDTDLEKLTATQGHLVVRVAPSGATYQMIVLDDSQESFRIRSVHGPYDSR